MLEFVAELVERALRREPEALRELVERLRGTVQSEVGRVLERYAPARRAGSVRQELEDLMQEVFAGLFADDARALRLWRPEGGRSLEVFVRWYARRQAISILRTGKRSPWTEEAMPDEALESATLDLEDGAVERSIEAQDLLEKILDRLPTVLSPEQLRLFELAFVEEQSVEALCATFDVGRGVIYQRLTRLRRIVRRLANEVLAETGDGEPAPH